MSYGFFLIANTITTQIIAMKKNSPTITGTKYSSATDCSGIGDGVAVGAAGSTPNAVNACARQYDSEPANDAYTVYLSAMSGVH